MFPWKLLKFFAHNSILTLVFLHDLSWEQLLLGGWGAPCCRALKVMTHFTLSCDGVWVRVVCIQLSRELTNTAELNLLCHHQQQTLYHLLGFCEAQYFEVEYWVLQSSTFDKCHLRFNYNGSIKQLFLGDLWFDNLWTILQLHDLVGGYEDTVKSWMHFNVSWSVCIHTVWPSVSNSLVKLFIGKVSKIVLKILSVFFPRYDNEYGYSHRVVDLIKYLAGKEWTPCSRPIVI